MKKTPEIDKTNRFGSVKKGWKLSEKDRQDDEVNPVVPEQGQRSGFVVPGLFRMKHGGHSGRLGAQAHAGFLPVVDHERDLNLRVVAEVADDVFGVGAVT